QFQRECKPSIEFGCRRRIVLHCTIESAECTQSEDITTDMCLPRDRAGLTELAEADRRQQIQSDENDGHCYNAAVAQGFLKRHGWNGARVVAQQVAFTTIDGSKQ